MSQTQSILYTHRTTTGRALCSTIHTLRMHCAALYRHCINCTSAYMHQYALYKHCAHHKHALYSHGTHTAAFMNALYQQSVHNENSRCAHWSHPLKALGLSDHFAAELTWSSAGSTVASGLPALPHSSRSITPSCTPSSSETVYNSKQAADLIYIQPVKLKLCFMQSVFARNS